MALSPLNINHPGIGQPPVPDNPKPISFEMELAVRQELFESGFTMSFVNSCNVDNNIITTMDGKTMARHAVIPGLRRVGLFFFTDNKDYFNLDVMWKVPGPPNLRVGINITGVPCLTILGNFATQELWEFLTHDLMNHIEDSVGYEITSRAGAVFTQGRNNPHGEYFVIEFSRPEFSQAFVDYINENFHYQ